MRLRRFLVAEYAERKRPAVLAFVLHDEVLVDTEIPQLLRLAQRVLAAALRRNEDPPAGELIGAALREASAERERLERLLGARRVGQGEAAPFEAGRGCRRGRGRERRRLPRRGRRRQILGRDHLQLLRLDLARERRGIGGSGRRAVAPPGGR